MNTEIMTTVEIADHTGHSVCQMTQSETLDKVSESPGAWVFAGNAMVRAEDLAQADWETIGTVRIVPGLVGGS